MPTPERVGVVMVADILNMQSEFSFSRSDSLREGLLAHAERLSADRNALMPGWSVDSPASLLQRRRFIVCGSVCRSEIRVLAARAEIVAIVDDTLSKQRASLFGVPLIDTETWVRRASGDRTILSVILVSHGRAARHFARQCAIWDLEYLTPLQYLHMLQEAGSMPRGETGRYFWYGYAFFEAALRDCRRLVERAAMFEDDYSRASWYAALMYRLTLDPAWLERFAVGMGDRPYTFDSYAFCRRFLTFGEDETFVDGGAFTGDTIEAFIATVGGNFRMIHAFEPSESANEKIRHRLRRIQEEVLKPLGPRVVLHAKGLWNTDAELRFNPNRSIGESDLGTDSGALAAHVVEAGMLDHIYDEAQEDAVAVRVPVTSIDAATNAEATFIKLEIEGAERQALEGARLTIARRKPQMAVSIYHKPDDLLDLTDFVTEVDRGYRTGFRMHNPFAPDGMVLYCF